MAPAMATSNATATAIAAQQQLAYTQQQQQLNAAATQQQQLAAAAAAAAQQQMTAATQFATTSPMMSTSPENHTAALYQGRPIAAGAYPTMNGAPSPAAQQQQASTALMAAGAGDLALGTSNIPLVTATMGTGPSYVTIGNPASGAATKLGSPNGGLQGGLQSKHW